MKIDTYLRQLSADRLNVLAALYFCWLLLVWLVFGYTPTNDGQGYLELAGICISDGQPYPTVSVFHYNDLPFIWNIGIVNLTALMLSLFGTISPLFPLLCLLKALTAWFLAKTTELLFSHRVAIIALLLYILYPNNWGQSTMISSEIPADFLVMAAVWMIVRASYGSHKTYETHKTHKTHKSHTLLLLLVATPSFSQQLPFSQISQLGLPVLTVNTINSEEPTCDYVFAPQGAFGISTTNNTKVPGRCVLTLREDTLFDSGEYVKDQSGMTLKIRGNTSAYYSSKKPFKLKLEKKNDLLARGDSCYYDKNWVLLTEGDNLQTMFGNKVNELVGMPWTPAMKYVNLIINGDYRGIYLLIEQVKRNADCRLNVDKHSGFIIERDAYWWNEDPYFKTDLLGIEYTFKYPDDNDVTTDQISYIKRWTENFENVLQQNGAYEQYIDLNSWASWLIAHEILGTYDSGGSNIFIVKNDSTENSLLQMSTLWDFGSIMKQPTQWPRIRTDNFFYFKKLLASKNKSFIEAYARRWQELQTFVFDSLDIFFDRFEQSEEAIAIKKSRPYEYARWDYYDDSLEKNIEDIRQWISDRQQWLQDNINNITTEKKYNQTTENNRSHYYNLNGQPINVNNYQGIVIRKNKKIVIRSNQHE